MSRVPEPLMARLRRRDRPDAEVNQGAAHRGRTGFLSPRRPDNGDER